MTVEKNYQLTAKSERDVTIQVHLKAGKPRGVCKFIIKLGAQEIHQCKFARKQRAQVMHKCSEEMQ